jgi:ATP adenylyltransferase
MRSSGLKLFYLFCSQGRTILYIKGAIMKQVWSPWRMKYIMNHEPNPECIFCKAHQQIDGPDNLIVARGQFVFAILNRYPYTSGHLMIVPFSHQSSLEQLTCEIRSEIVEMITRAEVVLGEVYRPDGFNIGANIGSAAGAGVAGHVHFHIVPRWAGDTNFMSTLAETRVLPEALDQTFLRIKEAWPKA